MNINNISAVPPRSFSTKLSPKEINDIDTVFEGEFYQNNKYYHEKQQL